MKVLNFEVQSIQFTMKVEVNETIPFLDVLVIHRDACVMTSVYRNPTQTEQYTNHAEHVNRGHKNYTRIPEQLVFVPTNYLNLLKIA